MTPNKPLGEAVTMNKPNYNPQQVSTNNGSVDCKRNLDYDTIRKLRMDLNNIDM